MTLIIGQISFMVLLNLPDSLFYVRLWVAGALVIIFFVLWYLIDRSMVRTPNRPASGDIHHPHNKKPREHT